MAARTIYLVRHGQIRRDDDLPRYVGQIDLPLSEAGRRQAEELARRFRLAGLGAIACSDLSRSVETARIIGDAAGLQATPRRDLREVSLGDWEGCPQREIEQRFPEQFRARGEDLAGFRPPGGESFSECGERVIRAFHELVRTTVGELLIVGHAGVNRLLLCHVLGMLPANLFRLGQDYGCCNVLRCDGSRYQVSVMNGGPSDVRRVRTRSVRRPPGRRVPGARPEVRR